MGYRLWESGYRERYYEQKFGVPYTDLEFRTKYACLVWVHERCTENLSRITTHYVEGLAWVLHYYYQGVSRVTNPSIVRWSYKIPDTFVAMVLPLPFRSFRRRFHRRRANGYKVRSWPAIQTVRTTYECFPRC